MTHHVRNILLFLLFLLIVGGNAVINPPEGTLACADGQGFFNGDYLVLKASEGSNAFITYNKEGNLVKTYALPGQVGPDHDLWVEDCVQQIAAQQ